jgi:hypothetical protein
MLERSGPAPVAASNGTGIREFIRSLDALERVVPAGKMIHVILDNYAAHEHGTGGAAEFSIRPDRWALGQPRRCRPRLVCFGC